MHNMLQRIGEMGIVPVVVLEDAVDAAPLAQALIQGGLPCAEVTFRTPAAKDAIGIMAEQFPDMLVGAGTVLTIQQVDDAVSAGAKFIVSPGFNPHIVSYCVEKQIPIIPGCSTPSDIEQALEYNLKVVKFFPAEAAGGLSMIKAIAAPYVGVRFMPTGGINASNVRSYLAFDRILACGGSWMVPKDMVEEGNFEKIKELTREAVQIVRESRGV